LVLKQREHIDGKEQPLSVRLSSVGSLSNMSLQTMMDLEGGMSLDQMRLVHDSLEK